MLSFFAATNASAADPPQRSDANETRPNRADRVRVSWSTPPECPSSEDLARRVSTRLPAGVDVRAHGRVERSERYRLLLDIDANGARGTRMIEAATCDSLASAAAVVIAMSAMAEAHDEGASSGPSSDAASTTSSPAKPSPADSATSSSSSAAAASPLRGRAGTPDGSSDDHGREGASGAMRVATGNSFHARLQIISDVGMLPAAGVGGGFAFGARVGAHFYVEGGANLWPSQDATVAGAPGRGASLSLAGANLRGCVPFGKSVEIAPCVGVAVERVAGSGFGAVRVVEASAITWSPEVSAALGVPLTTRFALRAGVGVLMPINRQSFVILSTGTIHTPASAIVRGWIGPELRF